MNLQKIWISAFNDLRDLLVDGATPLCGVMVSSINEHQWEANAHRCVETAIAEGRAARYVSISYTIEGGAIIRTLEIGPAGGPAPRFRVTTDDTRDRFSGDPGVHGYACTGLRRDPADPSPDATYVWVATGCVGAKGVSEVAVP